MLGIPSNLDMLSRSEHWFIDGTLGVAPSLFYQMLTIHALMPSGWVIPAVYAILP